MEPFSKLAAISRFLFSPRQVKLPAYHLAFGREGDLFVTGPTTSSFDRVQRIDPQGTVHKFFRGLGRPQGLALDVNANLRCGVAFGQARHCENHSGGQRDSGSCRAWARRTGFRSRTQRCFGYHGRGSSSLMEHSGAAAFARVTRHSASVSPSLAPSICSFHLHF